MYAVQIIIWHQDVVAERVNALLLGYFLSEVFAACISLVLIVTLFLHVDMQYTFVRSLLPRGAHFNIWGKQIGIGPRLWHGSGAKRKISFKIEEKNQSEKHECSSIPKEKADTLVCLEN